MGRRARNVATRLPGVARSYRNGTTRRVPLASTRVARKGASGSWATTPLLRTATGISVPSRSLKIMLATPSGTSPAIAVRASVTRSPVGASCPIVYRPESMTCAGRAQEPRSVFSAGVATDKQMRSASAPTHTSSDAPPSWCTLSGYIMKRPICAAVKGLLALRQPTVRRTGRSSRAGGSRRIECRSPSPVDCCLRRMRTLLLRRRRRPPRRGCDGCVGAVAHSIGRGAHELVSYFGQIVLRHGCLQSTVDAAGRQDRG